MWALILRAMAVERTTLFTYFSFFSFWLALFSSSWLLGPHTDPAELLGMWRAICWMLWLLDYHYIGFVSLMYFQVVFMSVVRGSLQCRLGLEWFLSQWSTTKFTYASDCSSITCQLPPNIHNNNHAIAPDKVVAWMLRSLPWRSSLAGGLGTSNTCNLACPPRTKYLSTSFYY